MFKRNKIRPTDVIQHTPPPTKCNHERSTPKYDAMGRKIQTGKVHFYGGYTLPAISAEGADMIIVGNSITGPRVYRDMNELLNDKAQGVERIEWD